MADRTKIRKAGVSGLFYSAEQSTLEKEVAVFLENSPREKLINEIYGIISPHAGYVYSGGVAARAYRQLFDRKYDVVVVIAPSHKVYFDEISIYSGSYYETPLGKVEIDLEISDQIASYHENLILSEMGHGSEEHSLEVQLPFLQHVLPHFKIAAIVMGNQDKKNIDILSNALQESLKGKKALCVASSDLSHFHHYNKAAVLDKVVTDYIRRFDEEGLNEMIQTGACEMCGAGPVVTVMKTAKALGAQKSKPLLYRNSGDITGDRDQVVGYLSAVLYS
jgi:AmmeMemoRadiSam system protein B